MINVTKPFFPPLEEYSSYLQEIWKRGWITNNGPLVNDLELKLKEYLALDHLLYLSNGTVAIQIAIKALDLTGEIITTPFSYVATTSSIMWENCSPVFVDIDRESLNIDPAAIEASITEKTSGILATHVFGNPCDIEAIQIIANKHNLKVIYDAAHCFGTKYKGKSVFTFGDISTTSFHATKLFHTGEGGAVITSSPAILKRMSYMRNFGHSGPVDYDEIGINGKNSELHAALGLVNLKYVTAILAKRKELSLYYTQQLKTFHHSTIKINSDSEFNYSYYPVIFETEEQLLKTLEMLNSNWIYPRRYFYPSLNTISYTRNSAMPVSESISKRILCLPLYYELERSDIDLIVRLMLRVQNN
ncbi:DegT/DnrJ/EryC1/StrS family aminotransferase [soil metagenome]